MVTLLLSLGSKPDFATYGKGVRVIVACLCGLSLVFALLSWRLTGDDFARGFLLGLALSLGVGSLYYGRLLRDESRLKAHYTKVFDERYQTILRLSAVTSFLMMGLIQTGLIILAVFWQVELPYLVLLLGSFYAYAGLFVLARQLWDKLL